MTPSLLVGIDIGGSGSRVAIAEVSNPSVFVETFDGPRVAIRRDGSSGLELVVELVNRAKSLVGDRAPLIASIGVGLTGLATLVRDPNEICVTVSKMAGGVPALAAVDAVTAHLGALGGEAGAVVAAGTGVIGFGTDFRATWRRVDGWGHILGDAGGGAWIGMRGLQCALANYDGRSSEGSSILLERARERFGEPESWPSQIYTRADRAGVLASFATDVISSSEVDQVARAIVQEAGRHLAETLVAALGTGLPARVSFTGGILTHDGPVAESFIRHFGARIPGLRLSPPIGDSLRGAIELARRGLRADAVTEHAPYLYLTPRGARA